MKKILSLFFWLMAVIMTLGVFFADLFIVVFLYPFDRKRKMCHAQGFWWADVLIWVNPFWSLEIRGLENIDPHKTYIVIANHESLVDIVIVYKTRMQFKWVAKASLFDIPIFGWCMKRMKYMKLQRGAYSSIKQVYETAGDWLRQGVSVLFFPEGTRRVTEEMNPFKGGAFKLAIKEHVPILPIYIGGSREVIPRGSWIFKAKAACKMYVLPEVDTSGFGPEDFGKLRDIVREKIIAASR